MVHKNIFIIIYVAFFSGVYAQAEEPATKRILMKGYVKNLQTISFVDRIESLTSASLIHHRLNIKLNLFKAVTARTEIRNRIFYGEQIALIPGFGNLIDQYPGYVHLSKLWVDERKLIMHSVIDRLLVQYSTDKWNISLGRQRINWGIHNIWNPNDIFNAYNFLDFDYEERPGNDAVRIQHYFKNYSTLELAYKPGKKKNETIAALLYKFNKKQYDIQVLGGIFNQDLVVGGGWAGNIRKAGFKGELSYFHPQKDVLDTVGSISGTLMMDYILKGSWYLSGAALFISQPSGFLGNTIFLSNVSAKALFPFRYSFYTGVSKQISLLTLVNMALVYSPEKNTLIAFPSFAWNVAKNFDIDFTLQAFFSRQPDGYKTAGNIFFIRGKWSY